MDYELRIPVMYESKNEWSLFLTLNLLYRNTLIQHRKYSINNINL